MASSIQEKSSRPEKVPWRAQPELCAKCGKCRSVCPVFQETCDESTVARGRLALLDAVEQGDVSPCSETFRRAITTCIGCHKCVYECPNSIEVVDAVHGARRELVETNAIDRVVRSVLRQIVSHRWIYDIAMRVGKAGQKLLPRSDKPPLRHLPLMMMDGCRIPDIAAGSFLKSVRGKRFLAENETGRVAFFVGCMINYVYPHVGEAAIRVLNRHGVTVVVPDQQLCCGRPALSIGDKTSADRLAKKNAGTFADAGITDIVCACASCSKSLKHEMPRDSRWQQFRIHDITEYLDTMTLAVDHPLDLHVTYHDPCHLRWGQDVRDAPRNLLNAVCSFEEMPHADSCCGFGGTFSMFHRDISQQIAGRKAESIAHVGPATVATACPGCMLQLQTIIDESNQDCTVRHIVELIDEAETKHGR